MASKVFWGLIFIAAGVIIALDLFNIVPFNQGFLGVILPVIFIIYGIFNIIQNKKIFFGGFTIVLSLIFLLGNWFVYFWKILFPAILILLGLQIIFGKKTNYNSNCDNQNNDNSNNNK
ncbi:hypothetical protein AZF37_05810 [endosymbiont 'TC1' of Trimyema compressum]|uniref:LiaF transmembrane domain-containing protein n=1 Tax=endosymbiont 'TC1' of Trimyema compressum TaxID=243899 RepID=UPI0007F0D157|nr:hypothetical protein [endosymbiont 'TC1' of Trimyema compressum]AMP20755.1 hypothetical protein AZF37_05810 [endosymbiont 'TC1' of Trimyema compressum]